MDFILLCLGSLFAILFILLLIAGRKYNQMVEGLSNDKFPFYALYTVGFALNDIKLFQLRGKQAIKLRDEAMLLYGEKYRDYYAHLTWAQSITFVLLICAVLSLFSGVVGGSGFFLVLMIFFSALIFNFFYDDMKRKLTTRREECVAELPNMISKLALLTGSGMSLREAWFIIAHSKNGTLYDFMKQACDEMNNGKSDIDAINRFGIISGSPEIKKFSSATIQSLEKGGGSDLVAFLASQCSEMWSHRKQVLLQKGEKAAGKLVAPIGIMFAGVLIIVLSAALSGGLGL
jgi:tight adherence protein C